MAVIAFILICAVTVIGEHCGDVKRSVLQDPLLELQTSMEKFVIRKFAKLATELVSIRQELKTEIKNGDNGMKELLKTEIEKVVDHHTTDVERCTQGDNEIRELLKTEIEKAGNETKELLKTELEKADNETKKLLKTEIEKADNDTKELLKTEIEKVDNETKKLLKFEIEKADNDTKKLLKIEIEKVDNETKKLLKFEIEKADNDTKELLKSEIEKADNETKKLLKTDIEKADTDTKELFKTEIEKVVGRHTTDFERCTQGNDGIKEILRNVFGSQILERCQPGYIQNTHGCYKLGSAWVDWDKAQSICRADGAHLVSFESPGEEQALGVLLERHGESRRRYWTDGKMVNGNWEWVHNSNPFTYNNLANARVLLVGGSNSSEGRVEVNIEGIQGTVCDDLWDDKDATVVCRMLGYTNGTAFTHAHFGRGTGDILLDNVRCTGSEASIADCPHLGLGIHHCGHHEDAGVRCVNAGVVRLVGGSNSSEGRVEVTIDGQSGTVCDDGWDDKDATVVCRMLGYTNGTVFTHAHFGRGTGNILLDDVACTGSEASIADCPHNGLGIHNCDHTEDAGVRCYSDGTPPVVPESCLSMLYNLGDPLHGHWFVKPCFTSLPYICED